MFKFNKLLVLALVLGTSLFTSLSYAAEQTIATISRDDNKMTYVLILNTSEDTRKIKNLYKDMYLNGKKQTRENLDLKVLIKDGIILEQQSNYIVLILKSENFDIEQGGIINLDTLYSGISGKRISYEISLVKDKSGWVLMKKGKSVKDFIIQTNKVFLAGTVGIKNLKME